MIELSTYRTIIDLDIPFIRPETTTPDPNSLVQSLIRRICKLDQCSLPEPTSRASLRTVLYQLLISRRPDPLPDDILTDLDLLLNGEMQARCMSDVRTWSPTSDRCMVWRGDITTIAADAMVNAANNQLLGCFIPHHGCIDNSIHAIAGPRLRTDCHRIMSLQGHPEPVGGAKITRGYHLPSDFVIHTVGPVYREYGRDEAESLLSSCYRACLDIASSVDRIRTIVFCSIATGIYGYPSEQAAPVAVKAVRTWISQNPERFDLIVFNVFSERDLKIYLPLIQGHKGVYGE